MKIETINLPKENTSQYDLSPIKMDKLQKVVLLAGKNGAGKSRFFELLRETTKAILSKKEYEDAEYNNRESENHIKSYEKMLTMVDSDAEKRRYEHAIVNSKSQIERNLEKMSKSRLINFAPSKENDKIIEFVPKKLDLKDSYKLTGEEMERRAERVNNLGTDALSEITIPTIQSIQNEWANTQISDVKQNIAAEEVDSINKNYEKLKEYINIFLGTSLGRDARGHALLFGKRIGDAKLSDGQKILLQFCIALFGQETSLKEMIILMDEPENHLHPAALIEVLDKIETNIPNGQLWIATHSINVLAHFDPSYIWYIEKGEISYAGNLPQKVLKGLLGEEEEIEKLSSFLSLPAKMASDKFAFESLFYPAVVMTGSEDPQTKQIFEIISEQAKSNNSLKVLDFGMGQGRLLAAIYENSRLADIELSTWLDYFGFDAYDTYKSHCEDLLKNIYGDKKRYFNKPKDALTDLPEGGFDFIVMCNVLHEIDPNDWINLLNSHDSLMKLLKPEGHLMIVEDQFLAIGEKAHAKGFTVLDSLELKRLFAATEETRVLSLDYRGDGRLKAHLVPASIIKNVSAETRIAALKTLSETSKEEIKVLRKATPSFKNGKLHSFWAQQLANATLSLEQLSS